MQPHDSILSNSRVEVKFPSYHFLYLHFARGPSQFTEQLLSTFFLMAAVKVAVQK